MIGKDMNGYKLYVFDLDGTLYDQPKLRTVMATRLLTYYMLHPFSIKDMFILMHFRKVKDNWTGNASEEDMIKKVAEDKNTDAARVGRIVKKWIYEAPLDALAKTKDEKLIARIKKIRENGAKAVVLSDYPTKDKLEAMGVEVDGQYGPDDTRIDELKPSPKGLRVVMSDYGVGPEDVLMIGDREEKDGECAKAAGVDHIILPRHISKRDLNEIGF